MSKGSRKNATGDTDALLDTFRKRFESGDNSAPFQAAISWKLRGTPLSELPAWVIEHLVDLNIEWYLKKHLARREIAF